MSNYDYQVRITKLCEKDGGGFIALVPELPGCMSDGETYEEAIQNVKGAIDDWIKTAKYRGQEIPEPMQYVDEEEYSGKLVIRIPKNLHKDLSEKAFEQNISLNQLILYYLSRQMGIEESSRKLQNITEKDTELLNSATVLKESELKKETSTIIKNYITLLAYKDWGHSFIPQLTFANRKEGDE